MRSQLRIYDIKPGQMDAFAAKVEAEIFPIRRAHGFTIDGPWKTESNQYVWVVHHEGSFEDALESYTNDPARKNISFDPMDYIMNVDTRMMDGI